MSLKSGRNKRYHGYRGAYTHRHLEMCLMAGEAVLC